MATPILPLLLDEDLNLAARYFERAIKTDGCWGWSGSVNSDGYARLDRVGKQRKSLLAHRVSYAIHFRKDPGHLHVCHRCDNPICTNPDHLFLGTDQDNSDDMVRKGRSPKTSLPGELNPRAILTPEQVRYIKLSSAVNIANTELGRLFGVHHTTISMIKRGKSWPEVLIEED